MSAGKLTRAPQEIARVLETIRARGALVSAHVDELHFQSLLRRVEAGRRLVIERSPSAGANAALLARTRVTFHSDVPEWHLEFVAASPVEVDDAGQRAIELRFPEVLSAHQPRTHPRVAVPNVPLHCLADAGGITPFDASMVDIGEGGLGFLVYAPDIQLEPGTVLRACSIDLPGGGTASVDLEVRYSQRMTLPDGRRVLRSGCRFLGKTPELEALVARYLRAT